MPSQFPPQGYRIRQLPRQQSLQMQNQNRPLLALESAGLGTWSWAVAADQIVCDARFKSLIGIPQSEPDVLPMSSVLSHFQVVDVELTKAATKEPIQTNGECDSIHRIIWADHTIHMVRLKGRLWNKGTETGMYGIAIDVTWARDLMPEQLQSRDSLTGLQEELDQHFGKAGIEGKLLDLVSDAAFVIGLDRRVSFWNKGAERLYGWTSNEALGQSPHDLLQTRFPVPLSDILRGEFWEGELLQVDRKGTAMTVHSRWNRLHSPEGEPVAYLEINSDISAQRKAERAAMRLGSRALKLQDEERRRIGRELHDSLGQYLTALKINLTVLNQPSAACDEQRSWAKCVSDCTTLVDQCIQETRTLSHLLHPPLLDEVGFGSAATWFIEGFARRSGLVVGCDIPSNLPRVGSNSELCLFRVLQESLTNAHRHSGCRALNVAVQADSTSLRLLIKDDGNGIPPDLLRQVREGTGPLGIGLSGMKERVCELGGQMHLDSSERGTTITVVVPIAFRAASADAEGIPLKGISAA